MPVFDSIIRDFVAGDDIQIDRTISSLPAGDSLAKAWLTVKARETDPDEAAIFQKSITTVLSPSSGVISDDGSGDTAGSVSFYLTATDTVKLANGKLFHFDIQVRTASGMLYTPEKGHIVALKPITQASV